MNDTNVNVLVEAASMPEHESADSAGASCATDIELQTADTRQLKRIDDDDISPSSEPLYAQDDTIEIEPVMAVEKKMDASMDVSAVTERPSWGDIEVRAEAQAARPSQSAGRFSDSLLDLGEFDHAGVGTVDEDVVLDLDFEAPLPVSETWRESVVGSLSTASAAVANGSPTKVAAPGIGVAEAASETGHVAPGELQVEPQTENLQSGHAPPVSVKAAPVGVDEAE